MNWTYEFELERRAAEYEARTIDRRRRALRRAWAIERWRRRCAWLGLGLAVAAAFLLGWSLRG